MGLWLTASLGCILAGNAGAAPTFSQKPTSKKVPCNALESTPNPQITLYESVLGTPMINVTLIEDRIITANAAQLERRQDQRDNGLPI